MASSRMVIILSMQSAEDMSALESSNQSWPSWMAAATASCKATGGWLTSPLMLNGLHGSRAAYSRIAMPITDCKPFRRSCSSSRHARSSVASASSLYQLTSALARVSTAMRYAVSWSSIMCSMGLPDGFVGWDWKVLVGEGFASDVVEGVFIVVGKRVDAMWHDYLYDLDSVGEPHAGAH